MSERLAMVNVIPEGYRAVFGMEKYSRTHVDPTLYELVKLRASVINGCAFCADMHWTEAAEAGEDPRRLAAVSVWHESPFFTPAERAALALTDAVTRLEEGGVPDEVWSEALDQFGEEGTANLIMAIATINVWNRLAVTTRTQPPPLAP